MATSSKLLRYLRRSLGSSLHHSSYSLQLSRTLSSNSPHFNINSIPSSSPPHQSNRRFSSASDDHPFNFDRIRDSAVLSEHSSSRFDGLESSSIDESSFLPLDAIVSLLDQYHDFTGLPWFVSHS